MTILEEAAKLVDGERRAVYGLPQDEFPMIARVWSAILKTEVTAEQVILCMASLKLLRLSVTPKHRDSQVDLCGYTRLLEMLNEATSS